MKCNSCGVSLKADAKFCAQCGAPVEAAEPDGVRCPTCGTINRAEAKFCRRDGTPLQGASSPTQDDRSPPVQEAHVVTEAPTREPGRTRVWLWLGAAAALAAAGGGYWIYAQRSTIPAVADTAPEPAAESPATRRSDGAQAVAEQGEFQAPSSSASFGPADSAEPPRVSIGDRWVTEVVDHQDAKLNYRAERTVTDVGPDRIFTTVRTLGKDYVRIVEYTDDWALVATHLRSGATTTYSPALPYLSFPLQPGKSWKTEVVETDAEGKRRVHDVRARTEAWESVRVPAGTFRALKIVLTDDISKDGVLVQQGQDVSWYAPEVRRTVKTEETSFDPATGERRQRTVSLVEYSVQGAEPVTSKAGPVGRLISIVPPQDILWESGCTHFLAPVTDTSQYGERILMHWGYPISEAPGGPCLQNCRPKMHVLGKTVELEPLTPWPEELLTAPKAGDRFTERYRYGQVEVRIDNTVTFACPPPTENGEPCEVLSFSGVLTATDGARQERYETEGQCGS